MGSRAAAIDIGTNSVLLVVAERDPAGAIRPIVERATITRLGKRVDATGTLSAERCERTLACLRAYAAELRGADVKHLAVVGTSALRDARDGDRFLRDATSILGVRPEVIDGSREAALTFRGALSGLDLEGPVRVFDVGGGSTEVISGSLRGDAVSVDVGESLNIGSVRLFERHLRTDPPSSAELEALRADARNELRALAVPTGDCQWVGVAGTITTLAAIEQKLDRYDASRVHGCRLTQHALHELAARLSALPLRARRDLPGLEPARADIIAAGAWICFELIDHFGGDAVIVSDRGVRWGLLHELLQ